MAAMCDEHADIWNDTWRLARKDHKCCECSHAIAKGVKYVEVRSLYDGHWETLKCCSICWAHWQYFSRFAEGCITLTMLSDLEAEFNYDAAQDFILLNGSVADEMRASS